MGKFAKKVKINKIVTIDKERMKEGKQKQQEATKGGTERAAADLFTT